ncbi:AlpA family phage regulatory protein [Salmonella enterica subsp. salamae]|nr:AlpA family phage regulatory protein [Salmonella enterica subsp. salamae]
MQLLNQGKRLIRLPEVILLTGRCRASIYKDINANIFPKPIKIGPHSVAWVEGRSATGLTIKSKSVKDRRNYAYR